MDPMKYEFVLPVGTVLKAHFKNQETGKWEDRSYTIEQVVNGRPLPKGQKIRPDDVVRPVLGQGGFGITYLASYLHKDQNNVFKNYYAIKEFFLKEHCWRDEGSTVMRYSPAAKENVENGLKEFKAEGERLYRICRGNRNIVNVNETFECNGTAYYAMEYIEGGSLRDVVRSQGSALGEGVALSYIRPICEAVQYIHENFGLLHCDIKPDNIMLRLDADGQPRVPVLIDFGISIHFNKKGEATTTHSSIGVSPGYSPQEQYQGLDVIMETREKARKDGLANLPLLPYEIDVYALGATLYYLVTGKDPDVASFSLESQLDKRLQTAGVSDRMRTVITSAMRQNPMSRTSTVKGFLQGFEERYSLPQGFILRGPNRSYQIMTGLMEEGSFFLRYEAVEYTKPQNVSGGITTKSQQYHIYECYDKTLHHRNRDESVGISERSTTTAFEAFHGLMGEKTGLEAPGEQVDAHGVMACEYFMANGTEYFVVRHGYKPPVDNFFTKLFASVGGLFGSKKLTTEKVISSKIDTQSMPTIPLVIGRLIDNMVYVEGGTFTMGATKEQPQNFVDECEKPVHQVTLSSYYIGKYEVTQEEWEAVMGSNPSYFKGPKRPVENVSWEDCQEFIRKLNLMTRQTFRLPTEAEWEFAARGGTGCRGTMYAGGSDIDSVAWYDVIWYKMGADSPDGTHPVGQKLPNELGLYDMSGNVLEWCNDWYGEYSSNPQTNPQGPSSGSGRVCRGGAWFDPYFLCRVSRRACGKPSRREYGLGLRLAR